MVTRNGVWLFAISVAVALVAAGVSIESRPECSPSKTMWTASRTSTLDSFLRFSVAGRNHADAPVRLKIAATNAGPLVPMTVTTNLANARTFCVDVDLNHDGRFEGPGELAYATRKFDEAGRAELRLHGLIDGRYRARVRVDGIDGEVVSAVQRFELSAPRNRHLPISFEVNGGQTDSSVLFLGRAKNQMVYVTRDETVIVSKVRSQESGVRSQESGNHAHVAASFRLAGAYSWARPTGQKMLPGKANYFIGNKPEQWRTDIDTYEELSTDAYPGIRMIHRSSQGRLAYDFRVAPGANPADITLDFSDAERLSLSDDGDLIVHLVGGESIRHSAPVMYQEQRGKKQAVKGDWVVKDNGRAGYVVAEYDAKRELIIDPIVFSTYLGGSGDDNALGIAVDAAGNTYVVGYTESGNFPVQGPINPALNGTRDIFVTKINAANTAYVYSTFLGGSGQDGSIFGVGVDVDSGGNAFVTGETRSNDFPTMVPDQATFGGGTSDAFVAKVNPAGNALVFSTYLGGTGTDTANAIKLDAAGAAYIVGTATVGFPVTPGSYQTTLGGTGDAIVAKYSTVGALLWATYLGGSLSELGYGIALAGSNPVVTGRTASLDFPTSPGALQAANAGGVADAFITQLDTNGTTIVSSTYLGGGSIDVGYGIAVDASGNIYVGGRAGSTDFPISAGAPQNTNGGGDDGFMTKLNPTLTTLLYSTYIGGPNSDTVKAMAIDSAGNAYAVGDDSFAGFPLVNQFQTYSGTADGFIAVINATGTAFLLATYQGGSGGGSEGGRAICIDASNNAYVAGWSSSAAFPTLSPIQATLGGGFDGFVAKFTIGVAPPPPPPVIPPGAGGGTNEGNYSGSQGLGNGNGGEGTFGFGRQLPILKTPQREPTGALRVFNFAYKKSQDAPDRQGGLGIMAFGAMLLAGFVSAAIVYGRRRPA